MKLRFYLYLVSFQVKAPSKVGIDADLSSPGRKQYQGVFLYVRGGTQWQYSVLDPSITAISRKLLHACVSGKSISFLSP